MNKLLITTALKFVLYDEKPHIIHEGDFNKGDAHYTGMTWNNSYIFVAAAVNTKYIIHKFDKRVRFIETLSDADLHETHQIYWHNDRLCITNTGLNRIELLQENKEILQKFWGSQSSYDRDHINGIWADGNHFYISEYRNRDEAKLPSIIRVCDLSLNCLKEITFGYGIHNTYVEKGILYTLESATPQIRMINLETLERYSVKLKNVEKGLIRGLARSRDYWYIGVSKWETNRDKRHVGDAIILQLDNNFNEINRIVMPNFGPIHDVRVINDLDLAHNGIILDYEKS